MNDDRTVHATNGRVDVVRYDRSGKWYREIHGLPRVPLTIADAVYQATQPGWTAHERLPGGARFDTLLRRRRAVIEGRA